MEVKHTPVGNITRDSSLLEHTPTVPVANKFNMLTEPTPRQEVASQDTPRTARSTSRTLRQHPRRSHSLGASTRNHHLQLDVTPLNDIRTEIFVTPINSQNSTENIYNLRVRAQQ